MRLRFIYADGRVMFHDVAPRGWWLGGGALLPPVWLIREYPPMEFDVMRDRYVVAHGIERSFQRVDYAYPPNFIGPHRAPEYHEEP